MAHAALQLEDIILAELGEQRRARARASAPVRRALESVQSTPAPAPRPPGPPLRDTRSELSDLLFYLDAGYLELTVPDHRKTPGAL